MSNVPTPVPPNDEILIEIALSNEDSNVKGSIWIAANDAYLTVSLGFENEDVTVSLVSWSDSGDISIPAKLRDIAAHIEAVQAENAKPFDPNDIPF